LNISGTICGKSPFTTGVFDSIDALEHHLCDSLRNLEMDHQRVRSIVEWPWIINSLLN
jgi:hypothetical protein